MDKINIIVLRREDLNYIDDKVPMDEISLYSSFANYRELSFKLITKADFIVFVEDAKNYEILKNRNSKDSKETKSLLTYLGLKYD